MLLNEIPQGFSLDLDDPYAGKPESGRPAGLKELEVELLELLCFDAPWLHGLLRRSTSIPYVNCAGQACEHIPLMTVVWRLARQGKGLPPAQCRPLELVDVVDRDAVAGNWRNWRRIVRAAQAYAAQRDAVYRLRHPKNIRTPFLDNVRFLAGYKDRETLPEHDEAVRKSLRRRKESTPARLVASLARESRAQAPYFVAVWKALALRQFEFDVHQPLTPDSPIRPLKMERLLKI